MVARRWFQKVTIAMAKDVMSPEPIATEDHNNDGWFGDIIEEPLYKWVTRDPLLKLDTPPPVATEAFYRNDTLLPLYTTILVICRLLVLDKLVHTI
jgi:hypothetical protein